MWPPHKLLCLLQTGVSKLCMAQFTAKHDRNGQAHRHLVTLDFAEEFPCVFVAVVGECYLT